MKKYRVIRLKNAKTINLGTKKIRKYTSIDKNLEVNFMEISGRHPEGKNHFVYETSCHLMFYILSGSGSFICEGDVFHLHKGDVLEILPKTKFAVQAKCVKYLSFQYPAWSEEQSFIVNSDGSIIEDTQR